MALATGESYYRTHNASADYLYKLLSLQEDSDLISPIVDAITQKATSTGSVVPTTSGTVGTEGSISTAEGGDGATSSSGDRASGDVAASAEGFGLGGVVGQGVSTGLSIGAQMAGFKGPVANAIGAIGKGIANKGLDDQAVANIGINMGLGFLGVPGLAIGALNALGFNPAQGLSEMLGLSNVTPGYEGGFFGTPGIGQGITGSVADNSGTPAGYDSSDLGQGISTSAQTGVIGSISSPDFGSLSVDMSDIADAMADAVGGYGGEGISGDQGGGLGSNADGNGTGGGATGGGDNGGGANGGEDGGSSDGNGW